MNFTFLIGLCSAVAITGFVVFGTSDNYQIFADQHGIIIVIGGTMTVALLSFPLKRLIGAMGVLFSKLIGKTNSDYTGTIQTIVRLSEDYRVNPKGLQVPAQAHPYLHDGVNLLTEFGFNYDELDDVLTSSLRGKRKRDEEEVRVWQTISRFPPAFGLLGATVGMIALLQTLGQPGAYERVGPAMATALVATFYGLATANFLLIPLSENLSEIAREDLVLRQIIREGILLIHEKKHPLYIEEYLKSFLSPNQRKIEMGSGGSSGRKAA